MSVKNAWLAAIGVLVVGCGGPGSFKGEVDGHALSVVDALFVPLKNEQGEIKGVLVALSDVPELCSVINANRDPKGATLAWFTLFRPRSDGETTLAPNAGSYTVTAEPLAAPKGNTAFVSFTKSDVNCRNEVVPERGLAKSGTVEVEEIAFEKDGMLTGNFDLTFGTQGDKVTGTFNATYCEMSESSGAASNCE